MERESSNSMQTLCRSGCGFYGNSSTDGLCSMCYKEALKKKNHPPNGPVAASASAASANSVTSGLSNNGDSFMGHAIPTIPLVSPISLLATTMATTTTTASTNTEKNESEIEELTTQAASKTRTESESEDPLNTTDNDDKDEKTKKKNRCAMCRKKVGLTGFKCRCGGLYCGNHRYSDKHNCSFDYKLLGAQEISRNNPVVVAEKIQKI